MEEQWVDPMIIVQAVVGLVAVVTGVFILLKAFSFQMSYFFGTFLSLLGTAFFSSLGLLIPLWFLSGTMHLQTHLTADLLMYGIAGLTLVAVVAFIVDHVSEMPIMLTISAAACFSIAVFPWVYWIRQEQLNERFAITISVPQPKIDRAEKDLIDELNESVQASLNEEVKKDATSTSLEQRQAKGIDSETDVLAVPNELVLPKAPKNSDEDWLYDSPKK